MKHDDDETGQNQYVRREALIDRMKEDLAVDLRGALNRALTAQKNLVNWMEQDSVSDQVRVDAGKALAQASIGIGALVTTFDDILGHMDSDVLQRVATRLVVDD